MTTQSQGENICKLYNIFQYQCLHWSIAKEDYYHILGVSRTATDQQIKRAYEELIRTLRKIWSTLFFLCGRNDLDVEQSSDVSAKLQEIEKAYKVLGDPRLRSTYDFLGARGQKFLSITIFQCLSFPCVYSSWNDRSIPRWVISSTILMDVFSLHLDDSGRLDELSTCDKILYGLLCCLTCCGCGCGCCCLCFGCCCCCDFFCNRCCGLCKRGNASVAPVSSHLSLQNSSHHFTFRSDKKTQLLLNNSSQILRNTKIKFPFFFFTTNIRKEK